MNKLFLLPAAIFLSVSLIAQTDNVGVGTNTPTTRLTVNGAISSIPSSAPAAASVTIPANVSIFRLTVVAGTQANALTSASPQEGQYLTIYNQDNDPATFAGHTIAATNGVGTFVYLNGAWRLAANAPAGTTNAWNLTGNSGTNPAVNFIGTTDAQPLKFRVNNFPAGEIGANTGLGGTALENITTGTENAAL
ncbi:MAG: hypothetical protein RML37_12195, partial [Chitinophagales bacterium]|nr:hypothetical protein [Chitinophagales bacterium]